MQRSTGQVVELISVNLATSGRYKCEVLAEAPVFNTLVEHAILTVVGKLVIPHSASSPVFSLKMHVCCDYLCSIKEWRCVASKTSSVLVFRSKSKVQRLYNYLRYRLYCLDSL